MTSKPSSRLLTITFACAVAAFAAAQDGDSRPASRPESAPADKVAAIQQEYEAEMKAFSAAYKAAATDEAKKKIAEDQNPNPKKWFPRLLEIAKAKDPAAVKALVWILDQDADSEEGREALAMLGREHAASSELVGACDALSYSLGREPEEFLRTAMKSSPHDLVRARAAYTLAQVLRRSANVSRRLADPSDAEDQKNLRKWYEGRVDYLASIDAAKYDKEAEDLLVLVKDKHGSLEAAWGGTLGARAEGDLFEIRNLAIGKVAPPIEGEDLFGEALKLSDFAGKVVVLDFWGHW
jgi:hypothetical protein